MIEADIQWGEFHAIVLRMDPMSPYDLQAPRLLATVVVPWIYCVPVHLDPQTLDASPQMSPVVLCGPDASIRHPPSHHTTPHSKGLLMAGST